MVAFSFCLPKSESSSLRDNHFSICVTHFHHSTVTSSSLKMKIYGVQEPVDAADDQQCMPSFSQHYSYANSIILSSDRELKVLVFSGEALSGIRVPFPLLQCRSLSCSTMGKNLKKGLLKQNCQKQKCIHIPKSFFFTYLVNKEKCDDSIFSSLKELRDLFVL